jgi:hypothetical protein
MVELFSGALLLADQTLQVSADHFQFNQRV